jgi:hypothetical protein
MTMPQMGGGRAAGGYPIPSGAENQRSRSNPASRPASPRPATS